MKENIKILTKIKTSPAVMVHIMTGLNYFDLSEFDHHGLVHDRQLKAVQLLTQGY
ncbi:MAG: hypothetical protein WBV81_10210 [Ignavibacteriaceae bacterium]